MRSFCCTRRAGRGQPVLFHAARPPQLSRAGYHRGDPRCAAAARFNGRNAPRALTSAACLARPADPARLCLIQIRIQRLTYAEPGEVLTSSGPSWHRRHCISLTAVLEFGPTETLPPVGAISKHPASLPTRSPIHPPRPARKAGFSTFESGCGRETDCLLEGDGFELPVPGRETVNPSWEKKPGADLLGNRRFESISLQRRVRCEPDFLSRVDHAGEVLDHVSPSRSPVRVAAISVEVVPCAEDLGHTLRCVRL